MFKVVIIDLLSLSHEGGYNWERTHVRFSRTYSIYKVGVIMEKKYIILYYPFTIRNNLNRGSTVRIVKIRDYFREFCRLNRYELIEISGEQKDRVKQIKEVKKLNPKDIMYCYMEVQNIPLLLTNTNHIPTHPFVDINFFQYMKKHNIPIGAFYRDIYWKFDDMYPLKGIKKILMVNLHKLDLLIFRKYIDILFLPSKKMNQYVNFPNDRVIALPSGGDLNLENIEFSRKTQESKVLNAIYVGSLHETSGYEILLESFRQINKEGKKINLTLVCRESEFKKNLELLKEYLTESWLDVKHLNIDELRSFYYKFDFAVIPYRQNIYNNFAMPVKLIEYISFGMPILSTNCDETARFINENGIGITVNDDVDHFTEGIKKMIEALNKGFYEKETIYNKFVINHTWLCRIEKIHETLINVSNKRS